MSDNYIVSARKYRPATFRSVVGQQALTDTLKGSINSGRLAHAYLFCGPRGVGKTSCARIFARTVNCLNRTPDGEACGECESCKAILKGNSFNLLELDAASNNSVNDIRAITEQVAIPPQVGKYRVFIIDEVHMLSPAAFNAFLKTLEEPPEYAVFILATTEKHKVLPTILSRCQIYDFKRITIDDIVNHLAWVAESEGVAADRRALGLIARKADGGMRDALSIFDQVASSSHGDVSYDTVVSNLNVLEYEYFFRLIDAFAAGDAGQALLLYKEVRDRGFDSLFFVNSLAQHVRDLMVAVDSRTLPLLEVAEDAREQLRKQAASLPLKWYFAAMKLLNDCDLNYRKSSNKQLLVEITLIRLSQLLAPSQPPFDDSDRPVALRNPSESSRATTSHAHETPPKPAVPTQAPPAAQEILPPSPAVSAQPAHPTPPKPRAGGASRRVHSFNINAGASDASRQAQTKKEDFTETDIRKAWGDFAEANPELTILAAAMKSCPFRACGNLQYEMLAENPAQLGAFEKSRGALHQYIRRRLQNDFVSITARLNPDAEKVKLLPPQEFLKAAVEQNPALGALLKELDAEMA